MALTRAERKSLRSREAVTPGGYVQQIDRAVADHLVRNPVITEFGESGLWKLGHLERSLTDLVWWRPESFRLVSKGLTVVVARNTARNR